MQEHVGDEFEGTISRVTNFGLFVTLDELFRTSDIISCHAPLTNDTRHVVNRERLATMKPSAIPNSSPDHTPSASILVNSPGGTLVPDRTILLTDPARERDAAIGDRVVMGVPDQDVGDLLAG
jgi:hypothetical protein